MISTPSHSQVTKPESELLYNWWFTANQFILVPSLFWLTTRNFFFLKLNIYSRSPCLTSSLKRKSVCLLWTQHYCYSTHFPVHLSTRIRILSLHQSSPGNRFITVSLALQTTHEVFLAQSNSFLATSSRSPWTAISRTWPNSIPSRLLFPTPCPLLFHYVFSVPS
jgi:hypothetical protein